MINVRRMWRRIGSHLISSVLLNHVQIIPRQHVVFQPQKRAIWSMFKNLFNSTPSQPIDCRTESPKRLEPHQIDAVRALLNSISSSSVEEIHEIWKQLSTYNAISIPNHTERIQLISTKDAQEWKDDDRVFLSSNTNILVREEYMANKVIHALFSHDAYQDIVHFYEQQVVNQRQFQNGLACYLRALISLKQADKLVHTLEQCTSKDLDRILQQRGMITPLLRACSHECAGSLARLLIDTVLDRIPHMILNVYCYRLALSANLKTKPITSSQLDHALHIYHRMFWENGYILQPSDWSRLINHCLYDGKTEMAVDIFKTYRQHGILAFDHRFETVLLIACRTKRFNAACEMIQAWIEIEQQHLEEELEPMIDELKTGEIRCLNRILWEMSKLQPSIDEYQAVLELLHQRQAQAGAVAIRSIIQSVLTESLLDPIAQVQRFFTLWDACFNAIHRNAFVMAVLLQRIEDLAWGVDVKQYTLSYAIKNQIELPFITVNKLMEQSNVRGLFEETIVIGEQVVESLVKPHRQAEFVFVHLIKAYLALEQFDKVRTLESKYKLSKRYQQNQLLIGFVHNAKNKLK